MRVLGRRTALLSAVAWLTGPHAAVAATLKVDFGTMSEGAPPTGVTSGITGLGPPPRWRVVRDATLPEPGLALAEVSRNTNDDRFPFVTMDGVLLQDAQVTTRFRAVDGKIDRAAGLMVRFANAKNYYVVRANALENNVRLYRMQDGNRRQLEGVDVAVPSGTWMTLRLRLRGPRFGIFLDDKLLFDAIDRSVPWTGKVGLWSKSDSLTHFQWIEVDTVD